MDEVYDSAAETKRIYLSDGFFVDFTKHFKYLGSFISHHLRDDYDIERRLGQANSAMGALKHFWNNQYVDLIVKYRIFLAIPINLLLWGCKSWALKNPASTNLMSSCTNQ